MSKLINKSIIKAMTIGISAVMTFSSVNLGAFAGEDIPGGAPDNNNGNTEPITDGSEVQTQSGIMQALDKAGEVKDLVSNDSKENPGVVQLVDEVVAAAEKKEIKEDTKDLVDGIKEVVDTDGNNSKDIVEDVDEFDDIVDENGDIVKEGSIAAMDDELSEAELGELTEDVAEAVNEMNDPSLEGVIAATEKVLDEKIGTTENEDGTVNEEKSELKETVASADGAAQQINSLVEAADFDALAEQVKRIIAAANQKIANATTVEEAEAAAKEASDAVAGFTSTLEEFTKEGGDYATLTEQYKSAVERSNKLNDLYDALKSQLSTAVERFNALQATASGDAETAKQEIEDLETAVNKLKEKAEAAKDQELTDAQLIVGELEKDINENSKRSWTDKNGKGLRDLCMLIVDNYIIPEVLNGEKVSSEEYHSHKNQGNYEGDNQFNGSSKSDVLDNYEVTYKYTDENGEEQFKTIRIGYKAAKGNNLSNYGGIVIFEKTEHTVVSGTDLTEDELATLDTENGYVEKTINDVDYIITKNADGVIESYKVSDFQTTVNQVSDSDTTEGNVRTVVEVDEDTKNTSYTYGEDGELVKTVTADVTTTTYTTNSLNVAAHANTLVDSATSKETFVNAINGLINGLKESQEDKTITLKVGETTVTLTKDSQNISVNDDLTVYGYNEGVTTTDTDSDIPASEVTYGTEDLAKAAYVTAINAILNGLTAEQSIKIGDVTYTNASERLAETDSDEKFAAYGYTKASRVSEEAANIAAVASEKATEVAAKSAYVTVINGILNTLTDEQSIKIGNVTYTNKSPRLALTDSAEKFAAYGYTKASNTTNSDASISASAKDQATEAAAKQAYVTAINGILNTLTDEQSIKIGDVTYTNASKRLEITDSDETFAAYGYKKASDVVKEDKSGDASAKDKATEADAKEAYVEALNAILSKLTDEQSITINDHELKKSDVAAKTVTVDNCGDYGYKVTTKNDNVRAVFDGYYVDGKFSQTVILKHETRETDSLLIEPATDIVVNPSSETEARRECEEAGEDWIDDQKDSSRKIIKTSNEVLGADSETRHFNYSVFGKTIASAEGQEWTAYGVATFEYAPIKEKTIEYSNIAKLFGASKQEEIKEEVRNQLIEAGAEIIEFTGWDWKAFKATFRYIETKDCIAENIYLDVAEDATDEAINAALADALKTETNGVYSATYDSKIRKTHDENYTTYGYDTITYKLNTNKYGYGTATITEYTDTYGYSKADITKYTNLYGYELADITKTTKTYGYAQVDGNETTKVVNQENGKTILEEKNSVNGVAATTEYRNENWYSGNVLLAEYDNGSYTTDTYSGETNKQGKAVAKKVTLTAEDKQRTADFRAWADAAIKVLEYGELAEKAGVALDKIGSAKTEIGNLQEQIDGLKKSLKQYKLAVISGDITKAEEALEAAQGYDFTDLLDSINDALKEKTADLTKVVEDDTNTDDQNTQTDEGEATRTSDNQQGTDDGTATDDNTATNDGVADDNAADYENADDGNADGGNADGGAANDDAAGNDGAVAGGNVGGGAAGGNDGAAVDDNNGAADGNGDNVTIENENAALAEGIGDADGNANEGGAGKDSVTIGNEDSALAEGIDTVQTHRKWNWWWLLVVAALTGGTTYGIIKGNRRKKEKANGDSDKKEI